MMNTCYFARGPIVTTDLHPEVSRTYSSIPSQPSSSESRGPLFSALTIPCNTMQQPGIQILYRRRSGKDKTIESYTVKYLGPYVKLSGEALENVSHCVCQIIRRSGKDKTITGCSLQFDVKNVSFDKLSQIEEDVKARLASSARES